MLLMSLCFLQTGGHGVPRPALDAEVPAHLETAVFAMG